MPFYQTLLITPGRLQLTSKQTVGILHRACAVVFNKGGWVRACQNHGERTLPYRLRSKYILDDGQQWATQGKYFSLYYDAPVKTMEELQVTMRKEEYVLRTHTMRQKSLVDEINNIRRYNPWNEAAGITMARRTPKHAAYKTMLKRHSTVDEINKEELVEFLQRK